MTNKDLIGRLETVAYRLRRTQLGKEWTRRTYEARIIEEDIIPALRKSKGRSQKTSTLPRALLRELLGTDPLISDDYEHDWCPHCLATGTHLKTCCWKKVNTILSKHETSS